MLRHLVLLGLALCGLAQADPPPRLELVATPAWKGWTRPGRSTEIDLRLSSDAATRATLDVVAGGTSVHADLDLVPGRVVRLQVPVPAAQRVRVGAAGLPVEAAPSGRELALSESESPLLGVALATDAVVGLEGFHSVALAAADLPHNASAFSSIDALMLDATTLAALDAQQLDALLTHAASCGRIVVLDADARVRRLLDAAGGCGGQALMTAASVGEAVEKLAHSLAARLPAALPAAGVAAAARPDHALWSRVALGIGLYFVAAILALAWAPSGPVLVLGPALAALAALGLMHALQPSAQLVVWSEGESGAQVSRYLAWQRVIGPARGHARIPLPAQLAPSVQACTPGQPLHLGFDANRGRAAFAEFDTRLFSQLSLCYAGSFPMSRVIAIDSMSESTIVVRNAGATAWPAGRLLSGELLHDLPALKPGATATLGAGAERSPEDAVARMARARAPVDGAAALWQLDLGGVTDLPADAQGWLLVTAAPP